MAFGYCKLTGKQGTFVSSHLLPKAVTRPSAPGIPFIESGVGRRPVRRWDSWYDKSLVTRAGEDILAKYDDAGIAELRRHGLLWSNRPFDVVPDVLMIDEEHGWGTREVNDVDGKTLRLFFLSLLWRAAASSRPEAAEIVLPPDELEQLRRMVVDGNVDPATFYPLWLTQLLEVGENHNHAPYTETMRVPAHGDVPQEDVPLFRFYFDGLIANFIRPSVITKSLLEPYDLHVGGSRLGVIAQQTDKSYQMVNRNKVILDAVTSWPEVMAKL